MKKRLRMGLIVNPLAGIGGAVGLKGSDGDEIVTEALKRGATPRAQERTLSALAKLGNAKDGLDVFCFPGTMGEDVCRAAGISPTVVGELGDAAHTTALDTERAAKALSALSVDLIVFAGGDGTARNICHAISDSVPVLGIPAGVKIHSGVYAVNSSGAANVINMLVNGEMVSVAAGEVRDIDEQAFREGIVKAKYYGELLVPNEDRYLQQVKCGGKPQEAIVLQDIAAHIAEEMEDGVAYICGPGTTVGAIVEHLGLDNTLLGVDVVMDGELLASDADEVQLLAIAQAHRCKIVITPIGGQGHILGRGNHQISPEVVRLVGKENIQVVSTPAKLEALQSRPLLVDSYDDALNAMMKGFVTVVTGFESTVLYRVE